MNIQQSKSWDEYTNGNITIDKNMFYKEGFPRYTLSNRNHIKFQLILCDGRIIDNATIDDSRQYYSEGRQWNDAKGNVIYEHWVVAWKEIVKTV
jgi:hypothetical protein